MKIHSKNYLYDPLIGNFLSWFLSGLIMYPYINDISPSPFLVIIGMTVGPIWSIWLHAYRDAIRIEIHKKKIDHALRFWLRIVIILTISVLWHLLIIGPTREMIIPTLVCVLYLGSVFWFLFDFMLNYHRGRKLTYISQAPNAAKSDRFFRDKKWLWIASKVILFFGTGYLYYRSLLF